jgi:hypothetical protein
MERRSDRIIQVAYGSDNSRERPPNYDEVLVRSDSYVYMTLFCCHVELISLRGTCTRGASIQGRRSSTVIDNRQRPQRQNPRGSPCPTLTAPPNGLSRPDGRNHKIAGPGSSDWRPRARRQGDEPSVSSWQLRAWVCDDSRGQPRSPEARFTGLGRDRFID